MLIERGRANRPKAYPRMPASFAVETVGDRIREYGFRQPIRR